MSTKKKTPDFNFNTVASIIFRPGAINDLANIVNSKKFKKVFLVTDQGLVNIGLIERVVNIFRKQGIQIGLFSKIVADPPSEIIEEASRQAIEYNADVIIGIGGGSSLDSAKLVALLALQQESLEQVYGVGNIKGQRLPLILIPTTAGTGSEATPVAIVTTGKTTKMGVVSSVILPDIAILDPQLTLGLPANITAATGIDAMVHAIEAYASKSINNNPISQNLATKALSLIGRSILTAVHSGNDINARCDMLLGSLLAGQAFANSPVAAVHALAYPIGGHYHVPHGLSNALVLPYVLRFNIEKVHAPYEYIAPFAFPELSKLQGQERAFAFCEALANLSKECGLEQKLRDVNIPMNSLEVLAKDAMGQTRLLVNNPRELNQADVLNIYNLAW
jgi:alcohol dehydrogenase class IV